MYNSQYYTCEQVDQRLLQGYLDDYNSENNTSLTKSQFLSLLATHLNSGLTTSNIVQESGNNTNKLMSQAIVTQLLSNLQSQINTESTNRSEADQTINGNLNTLSSNLNTESNNRETADQNINTQIGYYECNSEASATKKEVTITGYILPSTSPFGGHFKVKMLNSHGSDTPATLSVNNTGGTNGIPIRYNGEPVTKSNTWDAGEVIAVYYDGQYYQASNAQGGSNKKIDAYLLGDLRTLAIGQTYYQGESIITNNKQFVRITENIKALNLVDEVAVNDLKAYSGNTYKANYAVAKYDNTINYGTQAHPFAIGSPSKITLNIARNTSPGYINVNFNGNDAIPVEITASSNASTIASEITTLLQGIEDSGWTFSVSDNVITAVSNLYGDYHNTPFYIKNADASVITGVGGLRTVVNPGTDVEYATITLTISLKEGFINVVFDTTTINNIPIAASDSAVEIAGKIVDYAFTDWFVTDNGDGSLVAICKNLGSRSSVVFTIEDEILGVSGTYSIEYAGSSKLSIYDSEESSWSEAALAAYSESAVFSTISYDTLKSQYTRQNSVALDLDNVTKLYGNTSLISRTSIKSTAQTTFTCANVSGTTVITCLQSGKYASAYWSLSSLSSGTYRLKIKAKATKAAKFILTNTTSPGQTTSSLFNIPATSVPVEINMDLTYNGSNRYIAMPSFGNSANTVVTIMSFEILSIRDLKEAAVIDTDIDHNFSGTEGKVLGAELGKQLKENVDALGLSIQGEGVTYTFNTNAYGINGFINGNKWSTANSGKILPYYVGNITKMYVTATTKAMTYHLLKSFDGIVNNKTPDFYTTQEFTIQRGQTAEIIIPETCNYIIFRTYYSYTATSHCYPFSITFPAEELEGRVSVLENNFKVAQRKLLEPTFTSGSGRTINNASISKYGTGYVDISEYIFLEYGLFAESTYGINFYDANHKYFYGIKGSGDGETLITGIVNIPPNAKYAIFTTKYVRDTVYIYANKKEVWDSTKLYNKIVDVEHQQINSGYRYLADKYGLSPDNDDNSALLQSLVNDVNIAGGGIIEFPIGSFKFQHGIIWKSNVSLVGQGQNVTKFLMVGSNKFSFVSGDYVNNVIFKDFTVDASSMASNVGGKALFMRYIEDAVFENLKLINTQMTALGIDFLNRVKILNCNVIGAGRGRYSALVPTGVGCSGIGIGMGWASHKENFVISNCICDGCYNNGIFVEDQGRFASGGGTVMTDGSGQVIANNICRNGKNCGISVWGGKKVSIVGNVCYNNGSPSTNYQGGGFQIGYYGEDVTIVGNQSIENYYGFKIADLSKPTSKVLFASNEVRNNTVAGIYIATSGRADYLILKNNFLLNNPVGVQITGNSTGLVIQGNNEMASNAVSFNIAGTQTNAVIKDNTYLSNPNVTATFDGNTTFVEQFNE